MNKRVVFNAGILPHYRQKFHELVRERLIEHGVQYDLLYHAPAGEDAQKNDTIELTWARRIEATYFGKKQTVVWQGILAGLSKSDMVVLGQENRFLVNYVIQSSPRAMRPLIALWGHGRNFQSRDPDCVGERWKRFWATRADWWFGYTEETRAHVRSLGFPEERITVFNNSVDTALMRNQVMAFTRDKRDALALSMRLAGQNVGVFVGGVYPDKRIRFLIESADKVRAKVSDFELIIIGGGSDLPIAKKLAETRSWVHVMGPRFGEEKVNLMLLGHVFMMPGLMGLAILDAGTAGLAIATTAFPWHSPEIAYLERGVSGIKVPDWESSDAYAREVSDLLRDRVALEQMREAARRMASHYSIEAMAHNFCDGVLKALSND